MPAVMAGLKSPAVRAPSGLRAPTAKGTTAARSQEEGAEKATTSGPEVMGPPARTPYNLRPPAASATSGARGSTAKEKARVARLAAPLSREELAEMRRGSGNRSRSREREFPEEDDDSMPCGQGGLPGKPWRGSSLLRGNSSRGGARGREENR